MTARPPAAGGNRTLRIVGIAAVLAILAVGIGGAVYLFARSTPDAVSLPSAVAGASATPEPTTAASTDPTASAEPTAAASDGAGTGTLEGTWSVDGSIGSFADFTSSFVGYRVQEELVGVGAATAVGRTPEVTGTLTVAATSITAVEITADLTGLESDSDMRDGQLGRQGIQTDQFPTATFVLAEPIVLDALPADGETIQVTALGDLTLHGVTNRVEIPLQAVRNGDVVTVAGSLDIAFGDYGIAKPESMRVLSIEDTGVMELQLHFTKA